MSAGIRKGFKAALFFKATGVTAPGAAKRTGGLGLRDAAQAALNDPRFFGPKYADPVTGLAAGDDEQVADFPDLPDIASVLEGFSVWGNGTVSNSDSTGGGIDADTTIGSWVIGIDKAIHDNFILGLTLSVTNSSTFSKFNTAAGVPSETDLKQESLAIAPYAALILNENMYVDVSLGVNEADTNIDQRSAAGAAQSTASGQPSETRFIAANFNYLDVLFEHYGVLGVLGYTWSETDSGHLYRRSGRHTPLPKDPQ